MRFRELVETPIDETERRGRNNRVLRLPTRKEQALRPLCVVLGSAAIAARAAAFREEGARWRCRVKLSHYPSLSANTEFATIAQAQLFGKSRSD
jgi:hypothetical protein